METQTLVTKTNMFSSNLAGVASSSSVRRPESKDTNLKKRVLLNTKSKSTSTNDKKFSSSVSMVSNKHETLNLIVCQLKESALKAMAVNVVNDGSNLVCISCGKDVFILSHDECGSCYALSVDSRVIHLVLWIVDSGCSKHMIGNLKLLRNFVEKFLGIVHFGNNHLATITGYGDYGEDLLTGSRDSNLYSISISNLAVSSPGCLMSKATSTNLGYGIR
ncbi:hypothetical protein Tco_0313953 [Tanacetum coccineum]